jgi:hypothetical protein
MSKGARLRQPRRKMRRALRKTPPAYFDLVQWLRDRGYGNTNKACRDLILAGRVTADSHTLGKGKKVVFSHDEGKFIEVDAVYPHVPILLKPRVIVAEAK